MGESLEARRGIFACAIYSVTIRQVSGKTAKTDKGLARRRLEPWAGSASVRCCMQWPTAPLECSHAYQFTRWCEHMLTSRTRRGIGDHWPAVRVALCHKSSLLNTNSTTPCKHRHTTVMLRHDRSSSTHACTHPLLLSHNKRVHRHRYVHCTQPKS